MSVLKTVSLVLLSIFGAIEVVSASSLTPIPISKQLQSFITEDSELTKTDRKAIAGFLLKKVIDFDSQVPSLKPNTAEWVEKELQECTGQRCTQLYRSNEFVSLQLKTQLGYMVQNLKELEYSFRAENPYIEMLQWSSTITYLRDRDIFENYEWLENSGYIKINNELFPAGRANLIGRAINERIISKFLMDQYKKEVNEIKKRSSVNQSAH